MSVGPRTNLYNIGGDPDPINFFFFFFDKIDIVRKWTEKDFGGDPLMQSIEHSS